MALRACTYVSKKEKIRRTSWEYVDSNYRPRRSHWTETCVCFFLYACVEEELNETLRLSPIMTIASRFCLTTFGRGLVFFFFCAWVHRRRIQRTLPAPAFSASHSTPLDVLRCTAFDVWTRGSPSPLPISTSVSSTFSLTHSPLRIAIPLVPTVRHSPSTLIMSHGELPPILYLDSDIFIFERLRSIVPFNSWGRLYRFRLPLTCARVEHGQDCLPTRSVSLRVFRSRNRN